MPRTLKGFTLIELLIVVSMAAVLALAGIPMLVSNSQYVRAAEGRAAMVNMKDRARSVYQRNGVLPTTYAMLGMGSSEVSGAYFSASNYTMSGTTTAWKITCPNVYTSAPTSLIMTANLVTGDATFNR